MKVLILISLLGSFLFGNSSSAIDLKNSDAFSTSYQSYWKKADLYIYKRYKGDLQKISSKYRNLKSDLNSPYKFKDINQDKIALINQIDNLVRKSRDIFSRNEDINDLKNILKTDIYTNAVNLHLNSSCEVIKYERDVNRCVEEISKYENDKEYNNKENLLKLKNHMLNITNAFKEIEEIKNIRCKDGFIASSDDVEKTRECLKNKEEKLVNLDKKYSINNSKIDSLKSTYLHITQSMQALETRVDEREKSILESQKDTFMFWVYLILAIIAAALIWHFFLRLRCPKCRSLDYTELDSQSRFIGYQRYTKERGKGGKTEYKKTPGIHQTRGKNEKVEEVYETTSTYKCDKCGEIFTNDTKSTKSV